MDTILSEHATNLMADRRVFEVYVERYGDVWIQFHDGKYARLRANGQPPTIFIEASEKGPRETV